MNRMDLPPDHDARLAAARRRMKWELGDAEWADLALAAYMNPADDAERLAEEKAQSLPVGA